MASNLNLLNLPLKHTTTLIIPFKTPGEEQSYKKLEKYFVAQYDAIKAAGSVQKNMIPLLSMIKDLQLSCSGGNLPSRLQDVVDVSDAQLAAAAEKAAAVVMAGRSRKRAAEGDDDVDDAGAAAAGGGAYHYEDGDECPLCLEPFEQPYVTACGHVFCHDCITGLINGDDNDDDDGKCDCPMCRKPVTMKSLKPAPPSAQAQAAAAAAAAVPNVGGGNVGGGDGGLMISKLDRLVTELIRIQTADETSKCLVFSQFSQTLAWLQSELPKHGFKYRTLLGSMTKNERSKALAEFQSDPPTTIFLLSMRAGAVGVNLTQANHVRRTLLFSSLLYY